MISKQQYDILIKSLNNLSLINNLVKFETINNQLFLSSMSETQKLIVELELDFLPLISFVVDGKLLLQFLRFCAPENVSFSSNNKLLNINNKISRAFVNEFPEYYNNIEPYVEFKKNFEIHSVIFSKIIKLIGKCLENSPVGVYDFANITFENNKLIVLATDTLRIIKVNIPFELSFSIKFNISIKNLTLIQKLFKNTISFSINEQIITAKSENMELFFQLENLTLPDFDKLFKLEVFGSHFSVQTNLLLKAFKLMELNSKDNDTIKFQTKLLFTSQNIQISSENMLGKTEEIVPYIDSSSVNENKIMHLNCKLVTEICESIEDDNITVFLNNNPYGPICFLTTESNILLAVFSES